MEDNIVDWKKSLKVIEKISKTEKQIPGIQWK